MLFLVLFYLGENMDFMNTQKLRLSQSKSLKRTRNAVWVAETNMFKWIWKGYLNSKVFCCPSISAFCFSAFWLYEVPSYINNIRNGIEKINVVNFENKSLTSGSQLTHFKIHIQKKLLLFAVVVLCIVMKAFLLQYIL